MRGFALKVAISGPHLPFYERNAITMAGFDLWHSASAPCLDGKTFFVLQLYFCRKMTLQKSPKYQRPRAM